MPGGISVGQIALDLTLNKQGYESGLSDALGTAKSAGNSLARIFQSSGRAVSNSMTKAISGVTNQIAGMARKTVGLLAAAFSTREIVNFSKACIELGSDLEEVQNVVDVTFGSSAKTIDEFAKGAAESFGLSELAAKRYSSTIGSMFKSMGIAGDQVTEMSQRITELAGDMASFYNLDADEAFSKIRSGIAGITMPLQQIGISLNQANLEAYALANGFGQAYNKMSQAEQALVRYNYLLSVTSDAQGDFARTSQSWANQVRILQLRFEQLRATIGQGLINALLPTIQVINAILAKLQRLAEAFRNFTRYIFGNAGNVSTATGSIADSIGSAATGAGNLASGMKDTADAAKNALKWLAPFDELNVLNTDQSSGGSGGAGSPLADLAGLMDDAGTTFSDSLVDTLDEINPSLFTEAVKRAIERGDWYGVGALFGEKLNGVIERWDAYGDGFKLGEKIQHALKAFNGFLETFDFYDLGDKVAQWFIGLWNGITAEEVIQFFKNVLGSIRDFVAGFIDRMIKEWQARTGRSFDEFGKWVAEKLNAWIEKWQAYEEGFKLGEKIKAALMQLNSFLKEFNFVSLGTKVADWIAGMVDGITPEVMADTIATAINSAIGLGLGLSKELKEKKIPEKIGKAIGLAFAGINWGDAATTVSNIITGLANMLNSAMSSFVDNGGPEKIKTAMGTIGTAIGEAFASIDGADLAAIISAIVGGLVEMFKKAFEAFSAGDGWKELGELFKGLPWGSLFILKAIPLTLEIGKILIKGLVGKVIMNAVTSAITSAVGGGAAAAASTAAAAAGTGAVALGATLALPLTLAVIGVTGLAVAIKTINDAVSGVTPWGTTRIENPDGSSVELPDYLVEDYMNGRERSTEIGNALWNDVNAAVNAEMEKYGLTGSSKTSGKSSKTVESLDKNVGIIAEGLENSNSHWNPQEGFTWGGTLGSGWNFNTSSKKASATGDLASKMVGGLKGDNIFANALYDPMKNTMVRINELVDRSDLPHRLTTLTEKSGSSIKRGITEAAIPDTIGNEATVGLSRFGEKDYAGTGRSAMDKIKSAVKGADFPNALGNEAVVGLSKFGEKDFWGTGRHAIINMKNGLSTEDLPGNLGTVAVNMITRFKSANWAGAGAAAGQTMGAHFKANLAAAANSVVTTTASGRPETFARIAVMGNGGFPQFSQGSLFMLAGERTHQAEMVGNINGKTGVASGSEITGIGDAVRDASDEETRLLRETNALLNALLAKDPFRTPNSAAGRFFSQSIQAYERVKG